MGSLFTARALAGSRGLLTRPPLVAPQARLLGALESLSPVFGQLVLAAPRWRARSAGGGGEACFAPARSSGR